MTCKIYIDIETIPTSREDIKARAIEKVAPPANYKKAETIAEWWKNEGESAKQDAIGQTALNGTWGEIICIGFAVNDGPVEVVGRGLTEADCINTWMLKLQGQARATVRSGDMWEQSAIWIGHNVADFDLRFLWQRSKILGIRLPFALPLGKPAYNRGPYVYDTMKEWAGWGGKIKQTDLELAFGVERKDPLPTGGAEVFKAYLEGRIDDIKEHCRQDIENLRAIHNRMAA